MGRVLAIDYGRKRCGIAVTDTLRISANGLPTVRACDLMDFLKDYCAGNEVDLIVVGLPRTIKGEDSESADYIEPFLRRLRHEMPQMKVERFDERFTSVLAHRAMLDAGLSKSRRREKELADKTAAVIILTDWLQSRAAGGFNIPGL
ncbi:MAG: Holliday junction resolvase RuvX [Muribaculaceae bacterium]|nr:Holliday junction resolvase RuvX [Muribaculaceae bacterium]MDE6558299.1 Holliday junction resolvase RuvX [Muribaculaceae bacterium]